MKHFFYLSFFCVMALAACTNSSFKKGDNGLEYKIISDGKGKKLSYGNFIQLHYVQVYKGKKDTIIGDSRDYMPQINLFDSLATPPEYFKILKQVRLGDSIVLRTRVDSFYKRAPEKIPVFMKKSDFIYTSLMIVNIFETKAQADSASKAEIKMGRPKIFKKQLKDFEKEFLSKNMGQINNDDKVIADYLAKNNIKATKTTWGTYISIVTEGTGDLLTAGDVAYVNYTGHTLDSGKVFDSNTDPKFKHVEPYQVPISQLGSVVLGWSDALMHMKNGSKAIVYIPSSLGYGTEGKGADIKPNDILVFDMEVAKVENEDELMAKQQEMQRQMEIQKRVTDSLIRANGNKK